MPAARGNSWWLENRVTPTMHRLLRIFGSIIAGYFLLHESQCAPALAGPVKIWHEPQPWLLAALKNTHAEHVFFGSGAASV